jgi:hypothetical protein
VGRVIVSLDALKQSVASKYSKEKQQIFDGIAKFGME